MNTMPRWMPDDTSLLVYQMQPRRALRKVVIETGTATTELPWNWEREGWAVPDPRGARLVYTLIRNFRPEATRVRELASGREWPLERALDRPRWSPDGAAIAGAAGGRIVVCAAAGRPCREVTDGFAAAWSGDGAHLYFLRAAPARGSFALCRIGVDGSAAREVASVGPFRSIDVHFDVSRRDEIVWTEFREGRHELWMGRLQ